HLKGLEDKNSDISEPTQGRILLNMEGMEGEIRIEEMQPQLSMDLIKMMEQRLSTIENRNAELQRFLDQPELTSSEYSTANKELRKLRDSVDLISELRAKQKVTQLDLVQVDIFDAFFLNDKH
ncbi:hypothetical protein HAX54_035120, partial [Datura stramonium]|nr:hypothetical protein [Datura stramonium]